MRRFNVVGRQGRVFPLGCHDEASSEEKSLEIEGIWHLNGRGIRFHLLPRGRLSIPSLPLSVGPRISPRPSRKDRRIPAHIARPSLAARARTTGSGQALRGRSSRNRPRLRCRAATRCSHTRIAPPQRRAGIEPAGAALLVTLALKKQDGLKAGAEPAPRPPFTALPLDPFAFLFSPCAHPCRRRHDTARDSEPAETSSDRRPSCARCCAPSWHATDGRAHEASQGEPSHRDCNYWKEYDTPVLPDTISLMPAPRSKFSSAAWESPDKYALTAW